MRFRFLHPLAQYMHKHWLIGITIGAHFYKLTAPHVKLHDGIFQLIEENYKSSGQNLRSQKVLRQPSGRFLRLADKNYKLLREEIKWVTENGLITPK